MAAPGAGQAALPALRGGPHRRGDRRLDPAGRAVLAGLPPDAARSSCSALTGFLLNIFYLLLGPIGGLTADRLPRLKLLIGIDLFLAACAALLAVMAAAGVTSIAAYLVIATLIGAANAFEMPVRQTLIRDIVEERALITSALGVSAMVFNVGRLIGPAIAGLVLAYLSEAWCFLLNALSYAGIIAALLAMRLPPRGAAPRAQPAPPRRASSPSLSVLFAFPAVRYLLPTVVAIGLFATPYVPLMPSIVADFFDGQSSTVGLLMSSAGGRRARRRRLPVAAAGLRPPAAPA